MHSVPTQGKKLYLEALRIVAIFLVVCNHTVSCMFISNQLDGAALFISTFLKLVITMGVPLFFMISGGLLLHKEESVTEVLKKRVARVLIAIVLFLGIQFVGRVIAAAQVTPIAFSLHFMQAVRDEAMQPYTIWYLYAYLTLMLMLPFIRPMAKGMGNASYLYMIVLQIFFCGFVTTGISIYEGEKFFCDYCVLQTNHSIAFSIMYGVFFMLVGYYLEHRINLAAATRHLKWILPVGFLSQAAFALYISACFDGHLKGVNGSFLLLPCIGTYLFFKLHLSVSAPFVKKMILWMGSGVFFLMMSENIFRKFIERPLLQYAELNIYLEDLLAVILCCLCGLLLGGMLKKLPLLKSVL